MMSWDPQERVPHRMSTTHPRWHVELAAWLVILALVALGWVAWQAFSVSHHLPCICSVEDASYGPSPCEWKGGDGRTFIVTND